MNEKAEKFISTLSPSWGLNRAKSRAKLSMMAGGYNAGDRGTPVFKNWMTPITDADSSVHMDRNLIVSRSRDNIRNTTIAPAIVNRTIDHAIGNRGLAYHSQIDREFLEFDEDKAIDIQRQMESIYKQFANSKESDLERQNDFNEKTRLTLQSELEGGDCFTLFTNKKRIGGIFDLKLQTIEGEYCSNPNTTNSTFTADIKKHTVQGVQTDSDGAPSNFWFSELHPGDRINFDGNKWHSRKIYDSRGRANILHHFNKIRPGQTRGMPILGPSTDKILQLGRASEAELMALVLNAKWALLMEGPVADTQLNKQSPGATTPQTDDNPIDIGSGIIGRLPPGVTVKSFDSKRPNSNFWEYFKSVVVEIGAQTGVPASLILQMFDKSYSASRGEVLLAWNFFLSKRTHMAVNLCQPTMEALMDEAVFKGMLSAPGYFNDVRVRQAYLGNPYNQWSGPTRPAINELAEAKRYQTFLDMEVISRKEISSTVFGSTWERVNDQLKREHDLRVKAGLEQTDSEAEVSADIKAAELRKQGIK